MGNRWHVLLFLQALLLIALINISSYVSTVRAGGSVISAEPTLYLYWRYTAGGYARTVDWSPDGGLLAAGFYDNVTYVLSRSGRLQWSSDIATGYISALDWDPSGELLAVGSCDYSVYVYSSSGDLEWLDVLWGEVLSVEWSPDGQYLAIGSADGNAYVYSRDGSLQWYYTTGDWVFSIDWSPDGQLLAVASLDGNVYVFSRSGSLQWSYATAGCVYSVDWSPDGQLLAVGSGDGNVRVFSKSGALQWYYATGSYVLAIDWDPSGDHLAVGSYDYKVYVFKRDGGLRWSYDTGNYVETVDWSPDGQYLAVGNDEALSVFKAEGGSPVWSYTTGSPIAEVEWSPDGDLLAAASFHENRVYVFTWGGVLEVSTSPSGASIYVNDTYEGTSPLSLSLPPGTYVVRAELEGYNPAETTVEVKPRETTTVTLTLQEMQATLTVNVNVRADVLVNGTRVGEARPDEPLTITLSPGHVTLNVTGVPKVEHFYAKSIIASLDVEPGGSYEVDLHMPHDPMLVVSVNRDAAIYVNGTYRGLARADRPLALFIGTGHYTFNVTGVPGDLKTYMANYTLVTVEAVFDGVYEVSLHIPSRPLLVVKVNVEADIVLNGRGVGVAYPERPLVLRLDPGTYTVKGAPRAQGYVSNETVITLAPDDEYTLVLRIPRVPILVVRSDAEAEVYVNSVQMVGVVEPGSPVRVELGLGPQALNVTLVPTKPGFMINSTVLRVEGRPGDVYDVLVHVPRGPLLRVVVDAEATILVDGRPVGTARPGSPLEIPLKIGVLRLNVTAVPASEDYLAYSTLVTVEAQPDTVKELAIHLPLAPVIRVEVSMDSTVYLDEVRVGDLAAGMTLELRVTPGTHVVEAKRRGYSGSVKVTVGPGDVKEVEVGLKAKALLKLSSSMPVEVRVRGDGFEETFSVEPGRDVELAVEPGVYEVEARPTGANAWMYSPVTIRVEASEGGVTPVSIAPVLSVMFLGLVGGLAASGGGGLYLALLRPRVSVWVEPEEVLRGVPSRIRVLAANRGLLRARRRVVIEIDGERVFTGVVEIPGKSVKVIYEAEVVPGGGEARQDNGQGRHGR